MELVPIQRIPRGMPFLFAYEIYYRDSIYQVGRSSLVKCYKCEKKVLDFKTPTWFPLDILVEPIPLPDV